MRSSKPSAASMGPRPRATGHVFAYLIRTGRLPSKETSWKLTSEEPASEATLLDAIHDRRGRRGPGSVLR